MTKRKQIVTPTEDDEEAAYLLTMLLSGLSPGIDKGTTFEIVLTELMQGMTEASAVAAGKRIARTIGKASSSQH